MPLFNGGTTPTISTTDIAGSSIPDAAGFYPIGCHVAVADKADYETSGSFDGLALVSIQNGSVALGTAASGIAVIDIFRNGQFQDQIYDYFE